MPDIHLVSPEGKPWIAGTPAEANDLLARGYRRSTGAGSTDATESFGVGLSPADVEDEVVTASDAPEQPAAPVPPAPTEPEQAAVSPSIVIT